jgi:uncharacterized protein
MKIMLSVATLFLIGAPQFALASETSAHAVVEEIFEIMDMDGQVEQSMTMMREIQGEQLEQLTQDQSSDPAAEDAKAMVEQIMNMMEEEMSWENMKNDFVSVYVKTFSEEDLIGIRDFFKSPIGQKWIEKSPELMRNTMEMTRKKMQEISPRIQQMTQEMTERLMKKANLASDEVTQ